MKNVNNESAGNFRFTTTLAIFFFSNKGIQLREPLPVLFEGKNECSTILVNIMPFNVMEIIVSVMRVC